MKDKSALACFGLLAFGAVNTVIGAIIDGYVLVKLWSWFAVPVFGVPQISLAPAIGIGILVSFLTHQNIPSQKDREISEVIGAALGETILYPAVVLFVGWVVSQFMVAANTACT